LVERRIREVEARDLDAYLRLRGDPVMMAELGGPIAPEVVERSLLREVDDTAAGRAAVVMIEVRVDGRWLPAGNVSLVLVGSEREASSEIGWMVLPEFQRQGLARWAVGELLGSAGVAGIWGDVHAYPAVTNAPSNAICRALGFRLAATGRTEFNGQAFETNDWVLESSAHET
jgi:RimJ/RimL family protein N-acetyltransferase